MMEEEDIKYPLDIIFNINKGEDIEKKAESIDILYTILNHRNEYSIKKFFVIPFCYNKILTNNLQDIFSYYDQDYNTNNNRIINHNNKNLFNFYKLFYNKRGDECNYSPILNIDFLRDLKKDYQISVCSLKVLIHVYEQLTKDLSIDNYESYPSLCHEAFINNIIDNFSQYKMMNIIRNENEDEKGKNLYHIIGYDNNKLFDSIQLEYSDYILDELSENNEIFNDIDGNYRKITISISAFCINRI